MSFKMEKHRSVEKNSRGGVFMRASARVGIDAGDTVYWNVCPVFQTLLFC